MTSPTGHQKPPGTTESLRHPLSVRQSGQQRGRLARRHLTQYILDLQVAAIVGVADGHAQATRLLFQGRHCSGIEYRQGGGTKQVSANAEIVVLEPSTRQNCCRYRASAMLWLFGDERIRARPKRVL